MAEQSANCPKSSLLMEEKFEEIVHHLQNPSAKVDAHFRYWVKKVKFSLMNLTQ